MENRYILAIDQGTSATKAILFNQKGLIVHRCNRVHQQYYPNPGWVEHDPEEIYENTLKVIHDLLCETKIPGQQIMALAITNQRETALVWDKQTGKPVYNAIVWQCNRGSSLCNRLSEQGYEKIVKEKTGLVLSPYFSAAKIKWILDNVEGSRQKAKEGKLLFGTIDSWLVWKLTQGKKHVTDYSNASRTQLFNIKNLKWDEELLQIFTIPKTMTPKIKYSDEIFGYTTINGILEKEIPIAGIMGDSHAALFGQNCFEKGMAKATYGTGSSVMMNIGKNILQSKSGLVTSIAWGMDNHIEYVFEGNINCTGATIKWLVEDLELIPNSKISGKIAASIDSNGGVYLVPAFVGLSAPYWDSESKASITGISRGTKKAHIVRAAEESIAYQIRDILDLMVAESVIKLKELRVDGGATRDNFLMQFQANILNIAVVRNEIEELSAIGSVFMSGLTIGFWNSKEEIKALRAPDVIFNGKMDNRKRDKLYKDWKEAVRRTLSNY
ncbi:MAG: glycerol kinase GlpK [Candidatus Atribacteria bacterium]|nr:glycerol kinase GlpK [Candidatus Atribacteria bacterium]